MREHLPLALVYYYVLEFNFSISLVSLTRSISSFSSESLSN